MKTNLKPFILGIIITLSLGLLVGFFTRDDVLIYETINKPPLAPRAIIFPIVWTFLYITIGIVYGFIYQDKSIRKTFFISLFINLSWPIFFFSLRLCLASALIIGLLIESIIILMIQTFKKSKPAFYLLIPYLLWCLFALYLNIGICILN